MSTALRSQPVKCRPPFSDPMRRRGFTLLELILSITVAAMLSLALYSSMYTAFRARSSTMTQMSDIRTLSVAMDLIEQDLQSVQPPKGTLAGPFVGYAMGSANQQADSIDFYSIGRDAAGNAPLNNGFRRVQVVLKTDAASPQLVRRVTRNILASVTPEPEEEVLAEDILSFSVRYYDGTDWLTEWDSTLQEDALPTALEITLRKKSSRDPTSDVPYALTRTIALSCAGIITSTDQTDSSTGQQGGTTP